MRKKTARYLALGLVGLLIQQGSAAAFGGQPQGPPTATPIKHLVVIFQENVSFDHYFGTYPNAANPSGEPKFYEPGRYGNLFFFSKKKSEGTSDINRSLLQQSDASDDSFFLQTTFKGMKVAGHINFVSFDLLQVEIDSPYSDLLRLAKFPDKRICLWHNLAHGEGKKEA